jgi:Ca2+/H+ antiporter
VKRHIRTLEVVTGFICIAITTICLITSKSWYFGGAIHITKSFAIMLVGFLLFFDGVKKIINDPKSHR